MVCSLTRGLPFCLACVYYRERVKMISLLYMHEVVINNCFHFHFVLLLMTLEELLLMTTEEFN